MLPIGKEQGLDFGMTTPARPDGAGADFDAWWRVRVPNPVLAPSQLHRDCYAAGAAAERGRVEAFLKVAQEAVDCCEGSDMEARDHSCVAQLGIALTAYRAALAGEAGK